MLCENEWCVYQEGGTCLLREIDVDAQGHCAQCIQVSPEPECLAQCKQAKRSALQK